MTKMVFQGVFGDWYFCCIVHRASCIVQLARGIEIALSISRAWGGRAVGSTE
jgi:hypothetical protein